MSLAECTQYSGARTADGVDISIKKNACTVKTVTLDITKSLIIAPETLGTSAGIWIQP